MKLTRLICVLLTAALLLGSFSLCISAISFDDELVSVIVELEDGADRAGVAARIKKLFPDSEAGFSYGLLLRGFSLTLRASDLGRLASLDGVKTVYNDTEYSPCESADSKYELTFAENVSREYNPEFGKDRVIAVIDSGFNKTHEQFTLPYGQTGRLDYITVRDMRGFLHAYKLVKNQNDFKKNIYASDKVPFAFDYVGGDTDVLGKSNHGTAMSAIAAGNSPDGSPAFSGAAPAAQLLMMKVFEDDGQTAKTGAIIAALEDAYFLRADVISMSLGTAGGFSEYGLLDAPLEDMIAKLLDCGIPVICSGGNNASLGRGSVFDDYFGYGNTLAKYPDSGTVHSPSTTPDVLSVASANTFSGSYPAIKLAHDSRYIPYTDTNYGVFKDGYKHYFNIAFDSQTLEYVSISGVGAPEDFEGVDVKGKIALIERGELSFAEKNINAAKAGAVAAIIYDNVDTTTSLSTKMQLDDSLAYAIFISRADGLAMKAAKDKRISISSKTVYITKTQKETAVSDYSSSGPTPTLDIKPEITAEGENMSVAATDGGYTTMSGSSNAAAYVAGIAAGVIDKFECLSGRDRVRAVKALLMSAAEPLSETSSNGDKDYFSVNLQGAGMITPRLAKSAEVIVETENGAKLLLGNELGDKVSAKVTVKNLSDRKLSLKLSAVIGTEASVSLPYSILCNEKDPFYKLTGTYIYEYLGESANGAASFTTGKIRPFDTASVKLGKNELNSASADFTGADVVLGAGESRELTLDFDLSGLDKTRLLEIYENGYFVEGFILLDGENSYSIPFLGFAGDFYALDPFGESLYDGVGAVFGGCYIYSHVNTPALNNEIYIGTNNIEHSGEEFVKLDPALSFVSPYAKGGDGAIYLSVALLRNLTSLKAEVLTQSGERVTTAGNRNTASKAFADSGFITTVKHRFILWDTRHDENDNYIYDDGAYLCRLTGTDASGRMFTEEIPFEVDSVKPTVERVKINGQGKERTLEITVRDNAFVQHVAIEGSSGKQYNIDNSPFESEALAKKTRGETTTLSLDVSNVSEDYLYITVYDLAFNSVMVRIGLDN